MKALPELSSLQIHPRGLRRRLRGPGPGQSRHRGALPRASRGCQWGRALQEAVLTASWAAKSREGRPVRARAGNPSGETDLGRQGGRGEVKDQEKGGHFPVVKPSDRRVHHYTPAPPAGGPRDALKGHLGPQVPEGRSGRGHSTSARPRPQNKFRAATRVWGACPVGPEMDPGVRVPSADPDIPRAPERAQQKRPAPGPPLALGVLAPGFGLGRRHPLETFQAPLPPDSPVARSLLAKQLAKGRDERDTQALGRSRPGSGHPGGKGGKGRERAAAPRESKFANTPPSSWTVPTV